MKHALIFTSVFIIFYNLGNSPDLLHFERANLIEAISNDAVGANCFCRLGNERGYEVNSYPNSYHDFGSLKYWKRLGGTNARSGECARLCKEKMVYWLASKSNAQLCQLADESNTFNLVAYSKVGGRKWIRSHTKQDIPCTSNSPNYADPCSLSAPEKYTDFGIQIMSNGGTEFRVHATPKCKVPSGWGYHWRVCEFDLANGECVPNTELSMPDHWWTFNHACSFNGFNGTPLSSSTQDSGRFKRNKTYRIIFGVYGPGQEWVERKKYFNQYGFVEL